MLAEHLRRRVPEAVIPAEHPQHAGLVQQPARGVVRTPPLQRAQRHRGVDRAGAVRRADDARLAAGAGAGVARAPRVDEGHVRAAPSQVECGPAAERACADDDDPWLSAEVRHALQDTSTRTGLCVGSTNVQCIRPVCHRLSGTRWLRDVSRMQRARPAAGQAIRRRRVQRGRARLSRGHISPPADVRDVPRHPQVRRRRSGTRPARQCSTRSPPRDSSGSAPLRSMPRLCRPANQLDREQLLLRDRLAHPDARNRSAVGAGSGQLQQRPDQHRLPHDQARVRAAGGAPAQPDRAREGDARHARRGAQEPGEPAAHLHRDRDRADRRQPRLLPHRGRIRLPHRDRQGTPRRVQAGERRRRRRARRLQEMAEG